MKKRFLKISLAVLSTICLMASGSINAMQQDGPEIREQQNREFARNQFRDGVEKNEEFRKLLESYTTLDVYSEEAGPRAYELQIGMQGIYLDYVGKCKFQNITPFSPIGILGFLSSELQEPKTYLTFDKEIEHLSLKMRKNSLSPEVNPVKIFEINNNILYPKYSSLKEGSKFQASPINQGRIEKEEIKFFLSDKDIELINDPNLMIILLRMLNPLPTTVKSCCADLIQPWQWDQGIQLPFSGSFMLGGCLKIEDHKFLTLKVGKSVANFQESIERLWLEQDAEKSSAVKQKISERMIDELNKIFFVSGKQCYDIAQHGDLLAKNLQDWLNIMRELVKFERQEWKVLGRQLNNLQEDYNEAYKELNSTQSLYSGVSFGKYSISLTPALTKEEARDSSLLLECVNKRYKSYEDQLSRYEHVKSSLPALKTMQKWLESIYDFVTKKGNIS